MGCSASARVQLPEALHCSRWPSGLMRHCRCAALTTCLAICGFATTGCDFATRFEPVDASLSAKEFCVEKPVDGYLRTPPSTAPAARLGVAGVAPALDVDE